MNFKPGFSSEVIQRILELSADAQIERRAAGKESPAFYRLTGEIAAYGKMLALLTAFREQEECYAIISELACDFAMEAAN
jgi:hypothetical protein